MDKLRAIKFFCGVVEAKSFVAAAHNLDVPPSVLSKAIAGLERDIDFRLFNRTTRRVSLTDNGANYYERCKRLVVELEEAEVVTRDHDARPVGKLLAGLHPAVNRTVMTRIRHFFAAYPTIQVETTLSSTIATLIEDKLDVLITVGNPADSNYARQKIGTGRFILVASPEYLRSRGEPHQPSDLVEHQIVISARRDAPSYARWKLTKGSLSETVFITPRAVSRESVHLHDACLGGAGISRVLDFSVRDHLKRGDLKPVLADWALGTAPVNALYPSRKNIPAKARAFVNFVRGVVRDGAP